MPDVMNGYFEDTSTTGGYLRLSKVYIDRKYAKFKNKIIIEYRISNSLCRKEK